LERVAVIGNSGGGKSVLARKLAARTGLPLYEIDKFLWRPGSQLAPAEEFAAEHARILVLDRWIMDGVGGRASIPVRLERATDIVLVDMPLWMHYWLAAERQIAWSKGPIEHPPAGGSNMPPTEGLFRTMWEIDRDWMPEVRRLVAEREARGKRVTRIASVAELVAFA
jgi:adenylate kinase family enzyme